MKAGAFTPAILGRPGAAPRLRGRSMKAGAFTPAIPGGGRVGDALLERSMKAGAFTPAIRSTPGARSTGRRSSLNEGGGLHPRNPC